MPLKTRSLSLIFIMLFVGVTLLNSVAQDIDTIIPINKNPEKILKKIDIKSITQNGFNFWQDDFKGHFAGIDLGFNTLLNSDYSRYDTEFMKSSLLLSNSFYLNFIQQSISLQRNGNTIGLVTGLSVVYQGYRLDQFTTIEKDYNEIIYPVNIVFNDNQKSKLTIYSLMVPVLTEVQIPIQRYKNRMYLSLGPYIAYRISSHTNIKYKQDRREQLKVPDDFSLQDFKYGLMFRTGYRRVNLFATYELVPLFKKDKGPQLTPFTFGITLLGF